MTFPERNQPIKARLFDGWHEPVFFDQVGQGVLLPLVEPTDLRGEQHAERDRVGHGARVYITERILGPPRPSVEQ